MDQLLSRENRSMALALFEKLDEKLSELSVKSRDLIPYTTVNGKHVEKELKTRDPITWWTNGFWGGLMWLMYSQTKKECYLSTAQNAERLLMRAWDFPQMLDHDVGFLFHILSGASYALTGSEKSLETNLRAAELLYHRYHEKGDFIVAWNGEEKAGYSIIDTMMNLPLLYWATRQTGDPKYAEVAKKHADMTLREHIRPDGSVVHIANHRTDRPEVIETIAGQGFAVGSSWSRGAAWAIYGFALSYIHTGEARYLDGAKRVAHYFISNLATNRWLPLLDFRAPKETKVYDSTAGAIAACGLIEIARLVPEGEKSLYLDSALSLLSALEERFCDWSKEEDGILLGGSERWGRGENMHIIYGDYFFAEAVIKLCGQSFFPW